MYVTFSLGKSVDGSHAAFYLMVFLESQTQLPRDAATHSELDPPVSIINEDTFLQRCPQNNLMELIRQYSFLSSQVTQGCVKLKIKIK